MILKDKMQMRKNSWVNIVPLVCLCLFSTCSEDKEEPIIFWENPTSIVYGTALGDRELNATATVPGTFTYTPAAGTILKQGDAQPLVVDFVPQDVSKYTVASASVVIDVSSASTAIFNDALTYGTLTDVEGNLYKTITIGTQVWMAENLRVTKFRNNDPIAHITSAAEWKNLSTPGYCFYENTESIEKQVTNGGLYNWFAVSDSRSIAPEGWHVATDADWKTLTTFLGGESIAGGKLKESGITHWRNPNQAATNSSGFTALPAGRREYTDGSFINSGFNTFWWTSSAYNPDYSWYRQVNYDGAYVNPANFHKQYGFAVRCVKD